MLLSYCNTTIDIDMFLSYCNATIDIDIAMFLSYWKGKKTADKTNQQAMFAVERPGQTSAR